MIIEILNEARKKIDTTVIAKKKPVGKKTRTQVRTLPDLKLTNIPKKLEQTFGEEITQNLEKYINNRIDKGLYNETLIGKIPDNTIFFVFDTETTGLNMTHDDVITEIACLAYDKEFKKIDEYHASVELPEEKNPQIFIDRTYNSLNKIGLNKAEFDKILDNLEKELGGEKIEDYGENEITHKLMMTIYNNIQGHRPKKLDFHNNNYNLEDKKLLTEIYRIIKPLMKGENIKTILKMTKYGEVKAGVHEPDETSMVNNFLNFIHKVVAVKNGTPVLVAHNFPYDYKMVRQAFTRANKAYKDFKFIDTAQITRYYAYRYSYMLYLYNKKKAEKTQDGEHLKEVFKHHPMGNARMGTLATHYQIPNLQWHTAKNDVEATAQILKYLFAIDAYYKDYMNKKFGTDEHFESINNELETEINRHRYSTTEDENGEEVTKEVDWFSPLNNKYMTAHQEDFANFTEQIRDTAIYLEHFKKVTQKYYTKLDDYLNKNTQRFGANSDFRRLVGMIGHSLDKTYDDVYNSKSKKKKLEFVDDTASLVMRGLKQSNLGPKDYIYYGKEIGMNYKKYILLNSVNEFANLFRNDVDAIHTLQNIRQELISTNKESSINGIKRRLDNLFKDDNEELKNTKEYEDYINGIGATETHYSNLLADLVTTPKVITNEFSNALEKIVGEEEINAFAKFIKNMNKKKPDDSTRYKGPLWEKYSRYYINNDYIRSLINEY